MESILYAMTVGAMNFVHTFFLYTFKKHSRKNIH